jgi:hypothetical protein
MIYGGYMEKSDIDDNKNKKDNKKIDGIIEGIIVLIAILFIGYKFNWFASIGLNSLGISGCYYNESEKDALCIKGKEATFMSIKDTKYYIDYGENIIFLEDKYGNTFTSCKKVKDSKNIICGDLELHKK